MNNEAVPPKRGGIGMRVRLRRVELRMTIQELERRSGVHRCTISRLERGEEETRLRNFIAICQVLDVSPVKLICGSDQWDSEKVST